MMKAAGTPELNFRHFAAAIAAWAALGAPLAAHAQGRLFLSNAGAPLGETAEICVTLSGGGGKIAGLQLNLNWEDSCMTPANARRLCRSNQATGKTVQSALQGRGTLKAILISFSDVAPIPDGNLFCCEFTAVGDVGRCGPVSITAVIGSTGNGERINGISAGNTGVFTVLAEPGAPSDAVAGGNPPSAGGGGSGGGETLTGVPAPPPAAVFQPPGAVVGGPASEGAAAAPGQAAAGRAGPAVPGLGGQPRDLGVKAPPSGAEVVDAIVAGQQPGALPQAVEPRAGEPENLGALEAPTIAPTRTPEQTPATATEAPKATPTPVPNTPTPIPRTNTPTPESGWMGGCQVRS
jgi:hypothetical protein